MTLNLIKFLNFQIFFLLSKTFFISHKLRLKTSEAGFSHKHKSKLIRLVSFQKSFLCKITVLKNVLLTWVFIWVSCLYVSDLKNIIIYYHKKGKVYPVKVYSLQVDHWLSKVLIFKTILQQKVKLASSAYL